MGTDAPGPVLVVPYVACHPAAASWARNPTTPFSVTAGTKTMPSRLSAPPRRCRIPDFDRWSGSPARAAVDATCVDGRPLLARAEQEPDDRVYLVDPEPVPLLGRAGRPLPVDVPDVGTISYPAPSAAVAAPPRGEPDNERRSVGRFGVVLSVSDTVVMNLNPTLAERVVPYGRRVPRTLGGDGGRCWITGAVRVRFRTRRLRDVRGYGSGPARGARRGPGEERSRAKQPHPLV